MKNIDITAQSIELFKDTENLLKTLPKKILSQIKTAKFGGNGLECTISEEFLMNNVGNNKIIILPNKVNRIIDTDDYTAIYCGHFIFKITGDLHKRKHDFVFI